VNLDLYPIGWVHFVASLIALAAGAVVLVRPKGTPVHRLRGRAYVVALVITSVTALFIYRSGVFFFAHWFGVASLIVVALGFAFAHFRWSRGWMNLHLTCMIASYYMLVGGGVNEIFLRVHVLRRLVPVLSNSRLVDITHFAVLMLFAILIAYFNAARLLRPRTAQ